jgi:hypothetical protein
MTGSALAVSAATWTERYEILRHYELAGRQRLQSQPLGLALWVAKGMAGWMRQWTQLLAPTGASESQRSPARALAPGPWQQPLRLLLAQMTLQQLETRKAL